MDKDYLKFLEQKRHSIGNFGFKANFIPDMAFDFQAHVIDRLVELYSNPDEVVLTPFMGVGSEVFSPVSMGRKAIGIELKDSYFKQAKLNLVEAEKRFKEFKEKQGVITFE